MATSTRKSSKRTSSTAKRTTATKKARRTPKKPSEPSPEQTHVDELATATNLSEIHTKGAEAPTGAAPTPSKTKKMSKKRKAKTNGPGKKAEKGEPSPPTRKKLKFSRGKSGRSFAGGKAKRDFIDAQKFASMHPKVRKLLSSQQLFGKHQWKIVRVACEGEDSFSMHSACNYNASRALGLVDDGVCLRVMQSVADKEFRPFEDGSSGVSQKKLEKNSDTKVSELHFDGTMADADAATFFVQTMGELLFLFNVPFVFCKGFWKQHLKVAHEEVKPSAARKSMVETAPLAGIVGAPDEDFVTDFAGDLLALNKKDEVACAWIKARCAALVAFAKADANPDAFDLSADTKEARALYDELKKLKTKYKKDRRFAALSEWKLAGLLHQDPDDKLSCLPSLVLPSTAEDDELDEPSSDVEESEAEEEDDEEDDEEDGDSASENEAEGAAEEEDDDEMEEN